MRQIRDIFKATLRKYLGQYLPDLEEGSEGVHEDVGSTPGMCRDEPGDGNGSRSTAVLRHSQGYDNHTSQKFFIFTIRNT